MTDKTVSVPQCWKCRCLVKAHHGPTIGCEGVGGNCGCILTQEEASRVSVPTESRRPNRICSNCGVELFANYQEAGWNHCDREMKPFGNGCKFDGLFACAGKCQCPANTEMLGEFAASSSLLPVGRQLERELTVEETLRWLRKLEKLTSDGAKLIHVKNLLQKASLPVGESRPSTTEPVAKRKNSQTSDWGFSGHIAVLPKEDAACPMCAKPIFTEVSEPVAYRVKDFGDDWILHHTLAAARDEADGVGNLIQPLYAHPQPLPKPPEKGLGESREPLPGDVSKSSNETRNI